MKKQSEQTRKKRQSKMTFSILINSAKAEKGWLKTNAISKMKNTKMCIDFHILRERVIERFKLFE